MSAKTKEGLIRPPVMKPVPQRMSVDTTIYWLDRASETHRQQFDATSQGFGYAMQLVKDLLGNVEGEQAERFEIVVRKVEE